MLPRKLLPRHLCNVKASASPSLTQRILEKIPQENQAGGAGGAVLAANTWDALQSADSRWLSLKNSQTLGTSSIPFVKEHPNTPAPEAGTFEGEALEFDVVVCGGTLGIFIAAALAVKQPALKIAVVEQAPTLRGRAQEWNLSLKELKDLVKLGVLREEDLDGAVALKPGELIQRSPDPKTLVATHFKAVRAGYNSAETDSGVDGKEGGGFGRKINTDTQVVAETLELVDTKGLGKQELWVDGVLNLGVRPDVAIQRARRTFEEATTAGSSANSKKKTTTANKAKGVATTKKEKQRNNNRVFEGTRVSGVDVYGGDGGDGSVAVLRTDKGLLRSRLVIDAMGHASPIVRQVREGQSPDGVCLVVGTCASGFGPSSPQAASLRPQASLNANGDLIYTNEDMSYAAAAEAEARDGDVAPTQYFWEAFPAGGGQDLRTTYMFTYLDARKERPSLTAVFEDYWKRLRIYQGIEPDPAVLPGFAPTRALFAFFPTFRDSPLPSSFDRVMHIGDASGIQSPLSFGGFGALTRHLDRISGAVVQALEADDETERAAGMLGKDKLSLINPYMPNLSVTWMFQRAMSARPHEAAPSSDFVNRLLRTNFDIMHDLGDEVMKPFLQDVVQFAGLSRTLVEATVRDPLFIPQILGHVGPAALVDWLGHFAMLGAYTLLHLLFGRHILEAASAASSSLSSSSRATEQGSGVEGWLSGLSLVEQFTWRRRAEAWKFGAGLDYEL